MSGVKRAGGPATAVAVSAAAAVVVLSAWCTALAVRSASDAMTFGAVRGVTAALALGLPGALLAARRPRRAAGWLMVVAALSAAGSTTLALLADAALTAHPGSSPGSLWYWIASWSWVPAYALVPTLLLMALPTGLPASGWWHRAWLGVAAVNVLVPLAWAVVPYPEQDFPVPEAYGALVNPVGIEGTGVLLGLSLVALVGAVAVSVAAVVVRLRSATGREREQLVWVLAGGLLTVLLLALAWLVPGATDLVIAAAALPLPLAIAWSQLSPRLVELDAVVSRTLRYGFLTLLTVLLYAALLAVAGGLLSRVTRVPDLAAFVVAAVLVQPMGERVRRAVNRVVYGQLLEPHVAVRNLGLQVESATSAGEVLPAVVRVIAASLRLPYAAISVTGHDTVESGTAPPSVQRVPLVHRQHVVGELVVGLPAGGLGTRSGQLLEELTRQAATVAHALRLQEELQVSRRLIVSSREEERRRMRRDLHDDLGPGLAATAMEIERAGDLVESNPARTRALLEGAATYLRGAVAAVRGIVDDLRPGVLDDLGLETAVREHAARLGDSGLVVEVEVSGDIGDLPAAAEVAAYRIVSEALTNVVRHAQASRARVTLRRNGADLVVRVDDDGRGLPEQVRPGIGLDSIHQRAAELGGSVHVAGAGGTVVEATIPLSPRAGAGEPASLPSAVLR